MKITVVGMGPGGHQWLNAAARQAIMRADICIGAARLLALLPADCTATRLAAIMPEEIMRQIKEYHGAGEFCLLFSGDSGFYSGAKKLLPLLSGYNVEILPGISSLQLLAARLARPWQDWHLASAHGRACNAVALVRGHAETFFLTGGKQTARRIYADLAAAGLGACPAVVGERLGNEDERIHSGTVEELASCNYDSLAVLLVENPAPRLAVSGGFPDEAFLRGAAPMTKSEVRAVILSKLRLNSGDTVFDVGAGTGSVAVEAALAVRQGQVYAIESKPEACGLIQENARRFCAANITVVQGTAPQVLCGLPAPKAAFIGGSGGKLPQILAELLKLNPTVRLVISAVTLETLSAATAALAELPVAKVEIVQVAVSRARQLGGHHLLTAQNPVFLISGVGSHER